MFEGTVFPFDFRSSNLSEKFFASEIVGVTRSHLVGLAQVSYHRASFCPNGCECLYSKCGDVTRTVGGGSVYRGNGWVQNGWLLLELLVWASTKSWEAICK